MKYRFLPVQTFSGPMNMALDEVIMNRVRSGESLPVIRFYKWSPHCVSIGYFQGLNQEIDEEECAKQGVDITRRQTGGGAVFHAHEITYSIITHEENFSKDIRKSYEEICQYVVDALLSMEVNTVFSPINDVMVNDQKISGNAQTRKDGILLQHGTILYKVDVDKMFSLLKVGKEKISDKLVASVKKAVTSLEVHGKSEEEFVRAFEAAYRKEHELEESEYTPEELKEAKILAKEKYSHKSWIAMR